MLPGGGEFGVLWFCVFVGGGGGGESLRLYDFVFFAGGGFMVL